MLTQSEIDKFYKVLGVERLKVLASIGPGASDWIPIALDANEIERLMPRIVEKYGQITISPPLPRHSGQIERKWTGYKWCIRHVVYSTVGRGDTIAEAVARWVLAQEETTGPGGMGHESHRPIQAILPPSR